MMAKLRVSTIMQEPDNDHVKIKVEVDVRDTKEANEVLTALVQKISDLNSSGNVDMFGFLLNKTHENC